MTLRQLRDASGLSVPAILRRSGLHYNRFWRIETGRTIPNALEIRALAKCYETDIERIVSAIEEMQQVS
jgi:transcriptional regulator with XRE-family HTH domain